MDYTYVYLIRAYTWYKIGRTKDITTRLFSLATLPPFDLELMHLIECDDSVRAEKLLHRRFKDKRVRGEWFLLNDCDVAQFMTLHHFRRGQFSNTTDSASFAAYSVGHDAVERFQRPEANPFVSGTPGHGAWWEAYCDGIVTGPDLWCPAHILKQRIGADVVEQVLRERGRLGDPAFL